MANNPYSPYVDRTNGSTGWGANPTTKRGPEEFPPIPAFRPYASFSSPGFAAIHRLRNGASSSAAGAAGAGTGAGSGSSGRGADASGISIQGIQGIEGIPTLGGVTGDLIVGEIPPPQPVAPGTDVLAPPPDNGAPTAPTGTYEGSVLNRLRDNATYQNTGKSGRRAPQY